MTRKLLILLLCLGFFGCSMFNDEEDNDTNCVTCPGGSNSNPAYLSIVADLRWCEGGYHYTVTPRIYNAQAANVVVELDFGDATSAEAMNGEAISHVYTSCGEDLGSGGHDAGWMIRGSAMLQDGTQLYDDEEVHPCATCSGT